MSFKSKYWYHRSYDNSGYAVHYLAWQWADGRPVMPSAWEVRKELFPDEEELEHALDRLVACEAVRNLRVQPLEPVGDAVRLWKEAPADEGVA